MSAEKLVSGGTKVNDIKASDGHLWWLETRTSENGRAVLVSCPIDDPEAAQDRLAAPWSARTRAHEYGGGSWWLGGQRVYFVSAEDQRIYWIKRHGNAATEPQPITPAPQLDAGWRYADGQEHPTGAVLIAVREDHHTDDGSEPVNDLIWVSTDGGDVNVLVSGADFYQCPRISPDGRWISWVEWNHPNMPWQEASLKVAPLFGDGSDRRPLRIGNGQTVTDGCGVHGANWTADGRLVYSSDVTGHWNLYWWTEGTGGSLTELTDAEIGYPSWIFGIQQWDDLGDGRLAAIVTQDAADHVVVIEAAGGLVALDRRQRQEAADGQSYGPATIVSIDSLACVTVDDQPAVAMIGSTPTKLPEIVVATATDGATDGTFSVVRAADAIGIDPAWLASPQSIWFDSEGRQTHAFLYLPPGHSSADRSPADRSPVDRSSAERRTDPPPLIVIGHGGPTAHSSPALNLKLQYWASRGFAVVDVNYGGSSGFGKEYRDRLHRQWGVIDVVDCINAARHLADSGLVDGERMAIRGTSSGGLTVLLALIESDTFAAGVSLYGVTDLAALAADTHKFESRYVDWLVGAYPEEAERYAQRSPSNLLDRLNTPMLLMQGTDDKVVPPSQAEVVVSALARKGLPHLYVTFEGEGHGFRQADSLVSSLEVELWFYGQIFGFEPADAVAVPPPASSHGLGLPAHGEVAG